MIHCMKLKSAFFCRALRGGIGRLRYLPIAKRTKLLRGQRETLERELPKRSCTSYLRAKDKRDAVQVQSYANFINKKDEVRPRSTVVSRVGNLALKLRFRQFPENAIFLHMLLT